MKEFMTNPDTAYIITIVSLFFGFIGVVSAVFGIKSYYNQKRTDKAYEEILENAKRDWTGRYTEDEVNKLQNQLNNLSSQIGKEIPLRARKALLISKIESVEDDIRELCNEHRDLTRELSLIHEDYELDENIRNYISDEIGTRKPDKKTVIILTIIPVTFLFLASPILQDYFYYSLHSAIQATHANLYVGHIVSYLMGMIVFSVLILILPARRVDRYFRYHKRMALLTILVLFLIWAALTYCISFDVFIVGWIPQTVVGILSLLIFAIMLRVFKDIIST